MPPDNIFYVAVMFFPGDQTFQPFKRPFWILNSPIVGLFLQHNGAWGHPLKGTCQEKKVFREQESVLF
jgi:hypothetical protein